VGFKLCQVYFKAWLIIVVQANVLWDFRPSSIFSNVYLFNGKKLIV
jgi:hypothetical protein